MKRMMTFVLILMMIFSTVALAESTATEQTLSLTTGLPTDLPYKAFAVQFDNTADARPQLNMSRADIIYEMPIHLNGYTRYTAIFNDDIPDTVEAVRAVRVMNIDVAADWSAILVHLGMQDKATEIYAQDAGILHFNGMKDSLSFYRDNKRIAPYNAVARLKRLYDSTEAADVSVIHTPMQFSADNFSAQGDNVSVFRIPYGANVGFYPSYEYIKAEKVYRRFYNRRDMLDGETGTTYDFANVIVMYADYAWQNDAPDQPVVTLTGTNKCEYFINGKHFTGTWSRESVQQSTVYSDAEGNVVQFKPGKTCIQIVPSDMQIEIVR